MVRSRIEPGGCHSNLDRLGEQWGQVATLGADHSRDARRVDNHVNRDGGF